MYRAIIEQRLSSEAISKLLDRLVKRYRLEGREQEFVKNFFSSSELARHGRPSYIDDMNLHSDIKNSRFASTIISKIYRAWDDFRREFGRLQSAPVAALVQPQESGSWMYLNKESGELILGVNEDHGEVEMGKDLHETLAKAKEFYGAPFKLVEGQWVIQEIPVKEASKVEVENALKEARNILSDINKWIEERSASYHHMREAVKVNESEIAFQFNIEPLVVELPEGIKQKVAENLTEALNVYKQVTNERLGVVIEKLKVAYPNISQVGITGHWLILASMNPKGEIESTINIFETEIASGDIDLTEALRVLNGLIVEGKQLVEALKFTQENILQEMELIVKDLENPQFWAEHVHIPEAKGAQRMGQGSKKPQDQDMDSSHWFYVSRKSKEHSVKEDSTFKNCPTCKKTTTHINQDGKLVCTGCNQPADVAENKYGDLDAKIVNLVAKMIADKFEKQTIINLLTTEKNLDVATAEKYYNAAMGVEEDDSKKPEKIEQPTNKDRSSMGQVFTESTFDKEKAMGILHQFTDDPNSNEMADQEFPDAKAFMDAAEEFFYNVYGVVDEINWDNFKARMKEEFDIKE